MTDIQRLRELERAATPEPLKLHWDITPSFEHEGKDVWMDVSGPDGKPVSPKDYELLVEARNALPGLLDELERVREENAEHRMLYPRIDGNTEKLLTELEGISADFWNGNRADTFDIPGACNGAYRAIKNIMIENARLLQQLSDARDDVDWCRLTQSEWAHDAFDMGHENEALRLALRDQTDLRVDMQFEADRADAKLRERKGESEDESPRLEVLSRAVATYGELAQMDMAIEEASELIKAICKFKRNPGKEQASAILEEMADVWIMLDQLGLMFGSCCEIEAEKIDRLQRRLEDRDATSEPS